VDMARPGLNLPRWEGRAKGKFLPSKDEFLQTVGSFQRNFFLGYFGVDGMTQ